MRKFTAFFMSAVLLMTGCATQTFPSTTPEHLVDPVTSSINVYDSFNETGRGTLMKYFETSDDVPAAMGFVGSEMPDIQIKGYNCPDFSLKDYANSNTVIEITAYWCQHCQSQIKNMEAISEAHPELNFIQIFGEGESADEKEGDQIASFFEKNGNISEKIKIGEESEEFNKYAFDEISVDAYPTFLFFNEEGKLSFVFVGTLSLPLFDEMIKDTFDVDHALYKNLKNGYSNVFDGVRTWEDVKADIDPKAVERVSGLVEGVDKGEEVLYSNMGVKMESTETFTDLYGNEVNFGELSGVTMYAFLNVDNVLSEKIDVLNAFKKSHGEVNVIAILLGQELSDAEDWVKVSSKRLDGYVFDAFKELPEMLYPVVIYGLPSVVFVDEELKVSAGGYNGEFAEGALQGAYTMLTGNGAPYKSAIERG